MECSKCGYDDHDTGDSAHVCMPRGGTTLKDFITELERTEEGKASMQLARECVSKDKEISRLTKQRDELVAALKFADRAMKNFDLLEHLQDTKETSAARRKVSAALASVEKGK